MNLEVDVMEGDVFTANSFGLVRHYRDAQCRILGLRVIGEWHGDVPAPAENRLDLTTFTRYCEGCGLTVKEVKLEPAVETIKPPEWVAQCAASGKLRFYTSQDGRDKCVQSAKNWKPVRIDWGAK